MSDALPHGIEEFGPYVVYECLGQGGMATVHRAEKRGVGIRRPIALKRLLPHVAADPELVKLFVDEARLASHLHHANVAQTYELGKVGNTFFIAMEYASGPTLTQIARQCQNTATEVPIAIAVNILSQICEALDHAHNLCDQSGNPLRLIHRDVSPANIIVTNTGIVKLIDFGIAKATISRVKTQTGFIKGKFGYIAPEYITGHIDARVDLFAVGVIAHEMLAGRRLFEGADDFETMSNIREMVVQPPSRWNRRVTPDLDDIVMTALERDPESRWQSAGAMQVALANVARELGVVVGNQQLVEWVEWAFTQVPPDSGPIAWAEPGGETRQITMRAPRPSESLSIEVLSRSDIEVLTPSPVPRRALAASDSDQTVPLERVPMVLSDFEMLTPPAMAPAPVSVRRPSTAPRSSRQIDAVAPPPDAPRSSRQIDAVAPPPAAPRSSRQIDAIAPPPASRPSQSFEAVAPVWPRWPHASEPIAPIAPSRPRTLESLAPPPPLPSQTFASLPLPPPRPSQTFEALPRPPPPPPRSSAQAAAVVPSREIEVIVVPPERMFAEPTPVPIEPAGLEPPKPGLTSRSRPRARSTQRTTPQDAGVPAQALGVAPARTRRSAAWLVLLMIALGAGAMAAAYYWPLL